ncbi:MAG: pilus assembly protein CpaB [Chloroflexota bacterium]|nr:pilus assembly protein CpaB [Chloroflexota bacterium]
MIGVLLVVFAFAGVFLYSQLVGGPSSKTSIVGAAREIKTQQVLTADDLTIIQVDTKPTGALTDKAQAVGKIARQAIAKDKPVLDALLAEPAIGTAARLYFALPAGKVALNIPAGDISPYVQPGDQIDVIATPKVTQAQGTGTNPNQTKATLKGLRVLAVGAPVVASGSSGGNQQAATTGGNLVVEVSLQDAEMLQFIVKNTDFTYVLKSPLDQSAPDPTTPGVDLNTFKSTFGYR